jgi:hypothetical protein
MIIRIDDIVSGVTAKKAGKNFCTGVRLFCVVYSCFFDNADNEEAPQDVPDKED